MVVFKTYRTDFKHGGFHAWLPVPFEKIIAMSENAPSRQPSEAPPSADPPSADGASSGADATWPSREADTWS